MKALTLAVLGVSAAALAPALALAFALGPSLKVHDLASSPSNNIPESVTTLPLPPLRWLYRHAPGLNDMRATYRWFVATRFALVLTSGLAIAALVYGLGMKLKSR